MPLLKLVGWLLKSSSTTRLYRGRGPRQNVWQFYVLPHMRQSWETMTSASAGHIILTPTQPVGSGRPQRESNPGPPHQESRALPTELQRPPQDKTQIHMGYNREPKKAVESTRQQLCSAKSNLRKEVRKCANQYWDKLS